MDISTSGLSENNKLEFSHLPLINGLPDDIALFCLARVPRKYHAVLKSVSKRWRDLVCSEEWRNYRQKHNLAETWIYALCENKTNDQVSCYVLDPSFARQGSWKSILGLPPCCMKRKGMGFEAKDSKLYLLGGCGWCLDATNEVYCYDISSNTWSEAASMPTSRCYFGCEAMDGKIYAIGGYGLKAIDFHSWDTYDPRTHTWESYSDSNIFLDAEDSVVIDGKVYVRARGSLKAPDVAVFDPLSGKWQEADSDMAFGWRGPAIVLDDSLYVLDQSLGTKLTMWRQDCRKWVTVCRLSDRLTRPPCQMIAIGRSIFIIGKGLSGVVVDVDSVGSADGVIASSSIPIFSLDIDVISCKCVSI